MTEKFVKGIKAGHMIQCVCLKDNERVRLTANDKLLADHLLDGYRFFSGQGNEYFPNQDDLGKAIAADRTTVLASIKRLEQIGLVSKKTITRKGAGARTSNSYKVKSWNELNPIVITKYNPDQPMPLKALVGEQEVSSSIEIKQEDLDKCTASKSNISYGYAHIFIPTGEITHTYPISDPEKRKYTEAVLRKARELNA